MGYYSFPGGLVERGENPLKAAWRELKEETGLDVEYNRLIFIGNEKIAKPSGEIYMGYRYGLELEERELATLVNTEPKKHTDWQWLSAATLACLKMIPYTKECAYLFYLKVLHLD